MDNLNADVRLILEEITRYLNMEKLLPSFRNTVTVRWSGGSPCFPRLHAPEGSIALLITPEAVLRPQLSQSHSGASEERPHSQRRVSLQVLRRIRTLCRRPGGSVGGFSGLHPRYCCIREPQQGHDASVVKLKSGQRKPQSNLMGFFVFCS